MEVNESCICILNSRIGDPQDQKFHSIRLGNSKIKSLVKEWGPLQFLKLVGFQQIVSSDSSENSVQECLILQSLPVNQALCQRVSVVLDILADRLDPSFVADLAPPTPWQEVSYAGTS
mmetsp:Transcript_22509/g.55700  ORF Transcript_22509/g.55700 Transcript_22509/m.55700 type:complete len:118 (+) Transcript_22509:3612-3965(+)